MIFITIVCVVVCIVSVIVSALSIAETKKDYKLRQKQLEEFDEEYQGKIGAIKQIDENIEIEKENYRKCEEQLKSIHQDIDVTIERHHELQNQNSLIQGRIEGAKTQLETMNKQVEENKTQLEIYKESNHSLILQYEDELKERIEELQEIYDNEADVLEQVIQDLKDKRNAAVQQAIADYENNESKSFYMLQMTDADLNDIKILQQIESKLNNKEVLGKLIYKTYVEKYYTDLIGRVLNKEHFSGIYKITNQWNQMCYVGQAADISKRWQQHIKRAVGAEPMTNNKLYPAMKKWGVENFSFEVIDRCDKDKLNEREQYWQEFYSAKSFGYSIR